MNPEARGLQAVTVQQPTGSILILTAEKSPVAADFLQAMQQAGYHVSIVHTAKEASSQARTAPWDAVLITSLRSAAFLRGLSKKPGEAAPLRVFLQQGQAAAGAYTKRPDAVDCIITTGLAAAQLQSALELHRENSRLRQQLNELQARIQREETVRQHKRDEVELLRNAIVRNVSHELRTPLLQVKSAVALIADDMGDSTLIQYATNATARLETLVRNITLLGSSLETDPGPVIIRDAIDSAHRNLKRIWEHRGRIDRVRIELEENLPPVIADKQGLGTVIQLLMDNALKFSEDEIIVTARKKGGSIEIAVRDYGIGIPLDQIDTIFDTFYQVDNSSTRRYGGAGVGLAIVKLILDNHGTAIIVESEEKKGSTFTFLLPVYQL